MLTLCASIQDDAICFLHALLIPNDTQDYNKTVAFNKHYFYFIVSCCAAAKSKNYLGLFAFIR